MDRRVSVSCQVVFCSIATSADTNNSSTREGVVVLVPLSQTSMDLKLTLAANQSVITTSGFMLITVYVYLLGDGWVRLKATVPQIMSGMCKCFIIIFIFFISYPVICFYLVS